MIVYGELLFAENMIMGGVLLYITAMIHGRTFDSGNAKLRLVAGSVMCGAFSLTLFLGAKTPLMILMEVSFALAVVTVTFGIKHLKKAITFILVTYFMGGMVMGLLLLVKQEALYTPAGIYTADMKAALLGLFVATTFVTARQVVKTVKKRRVVNSFSYHARIIIGRINIETMAFVDTGNKLKDPISGKAVALASEELWKSIKEYMPDMDERFAVIPYRAVGSSGLLEAVRVDCIELMGVGEDEVHKIRGCLVARGDGNFQLLISAEMVDVEA